MKRKVSNDQLTNFKRSKIDDNLKLPIHDHKTRIIGDIKICDNYIIISTTGSGKTTQIPQFLYQNKINHDKIIGVSQPRRLATISIADRVAQEMKCKLGETVGYSVRFEKKCSEKTQIKFMTDGILLREAVMDPLLMSYSIIILDEVHERSLNNDILLGVVKNAQQKRIEQKCLPLKIVIMSATIDHRSFKQYLGNDTKLLSVSSRAHHLRIVSLKQKSQDYVRDSVATCLQLHSGEIPVENVNNFVDNTEWSILIFLTGEDEINRCCDLLKHESDKLQSRIKKGLAIYPLYSALPSDLQKEAVSSSRDGNVRNVIVSTNIAETSITIPGVRVVIDCGFSKQKFVNTNSGLESLVVCPISQAQAAQRAGRASRLGPGMCFRLYTDSHYELNMPEQAQPELMRSSLTAVSLTIFGLSFDNVLGFPWLDAPNINQVKRSIDNLRDLQAIEATDNPDFNKITDLGKKLLRFPLDPQLAFAILEASGATRNCLVEVTAIVAMLNVVEKLYIDSRDTSAATDEFYSSYGDLIFLLKVYRSYNKLDSERDRADWARRYRIKLEEMRRASLVHKQLKEICGGLHLPVKSCQDDVGLVVRCFARPFMTQTARMVEKVTSNKKKERTSTYSTTYRNAKLGDLSLTLHPSSLLCRHRVPPRLVLYLDCIETKEKVHMRHASVIQPDWIEW